MVAFYILLRAVLAVLYIYLGLKIMGMVYRVSLSTMKGFSEWREARKTKHQEEALEKEMTKAAKRAEEVVVKAGGAVKTAIDPKGIAEAAKNLLKGAKENGFVS